MGFNFKFGFAIPLLNLLQKWKIHVLAFQLDINAASLNLALLNQAKEFSYLAQPHSFAI